MKRLQHLKLQPWTYCLGNFPRSPVQCWMYERNRWTRISTSTLNGGAGEFFPTFETKVVDRNRSQSTWTLIAAEWARLNSGAMFDERMGASLNQLLH